MPLLAAWRLALVVVVLAAAVGSLLLLDRVNAPPPAVDPGIAAVDAQKGSRLLILILDSWRYETAIDSTTMPRVAQLRRAGASWEMETVFEGFTVPAVRAAFVGHAETQLVNFVQNFRFRALDIGSFFRDARRIGKRTLVVGNEPFTQFGRNFEQRLPPASPDMYAADRLRPDVALRGFREDGFDVVVCHYESADWLAHEIGVGSDRYRREFAFADSLIGAFADALGPNDYLLVFGDHGHSASGEHKTGIHIPTFALLLGPDVKRGAAAGAMATTNVRFVASHALGVTLRSAPYDVRQIAKFLPVNAADSAGPRVAAQNGASRRFGDYALALVVLAFGAGAALLLAAGMPGAALRPAEAAVIGGAFAAELAIQRVTPGFAVFPLVLAALGATGVAMRPAERAVALVVGVWFACRALGLAFVEAPSGLATVVPLYVVAIAAKFLLLLAIAGRQRLALVVAFTTAIACVELRVWDSPLACAALGGAGAVAWRRLRDAAGRRVAAITVLSALLYFTVRVPLYQLAWIDLFLGAAWLVARRRDSAWVDALLATGAFSLSVGWLASGLEWGFLYTMAPARVVEANVAYFIPLIAAKLPLLLALTLVVAGRWPTRRLVEVLLLYTGARFALAWVLRLGGAAGVEIWPLAEHGIYLTTFVLAAVVVGWRLPLALRVRAPSGDLARA